MTRHGGGGLHEVERWLSASIESAQPLLPLILGLPAPELHRQVAASPELRSAGVLYSLLAVSADALEHMPRRVLELTAVVIQHAPSVVVPAGGEAIPRLLQGQAWRDRAEAFRRCGRCEKAREAIAAARKLLDEGPAREWFMATVDLVEATLLHVCNEWEPALDLARRAARRFDELHDRGRYVQAVMTESSILWSAGNRAAVARLWRSASESARQRRDTALVATLEARIGLFELESGNARHALELLGSALSLLDAAGLRREAAETRWRMAEAAVAAGRIADAVSELYKVHAELVAMSAVRDAAVVSARIVELLLVEGRETAVVGAARMFVRTLADAGMPSRCLDAITWLERRAVDSALTLDEVRDVGRYFEEAPENLQLQPHAWSRVASAG